MSPAVRPAVYVGSLLDLNHGITHGIWIDATLPDPEVLAAIAEMLETSPTTRRTGEPAEEWLVLDSEGVEHAHVRRGSGDPAL